MNRRAFLAGITAACIGSGAGCLRSGPDMEFERFVVPDPVVTEVESSGSEYSGTIHNRRGEGNLRVELWHYRDSRTPDPSVPAPFQDEQQPGQHFNVARTHFFSEGERREVSITTDDVPSDTREFGIVPWAASHGAIFNNNGGSGEVEVTFEYRETRGYDVEQPSEIVETVGSDQTLEVVFDVVVPPQVEYEITADPV